MKRKTLLLSLIALFLLSHSKAQFSKGSTLVGADFSLAHIKDETGVSKQTDNMINFYTSYGKAVKENFFAGGVLSAGFQNQEITAEQITRKTNNYGIGGFVRKYIPVIKRLYIYGQADLHLFYSIYKVTSVTPFAETSTIREWGPSLSAYPGVSYSLTKKLQLEAGFNNLFSVSYTHSKQTTTNSNNVYKSGQFTISNNLNNLSYFNIGFRLLIQNS